MQSCTAALASILSAKRPAWQRGVTLVELVMYIVIVSVGAAGILLVIDATTRRSADPMVEQQALLIAESYMEEIVQKRFIDPTGGTTNICQTPVEAGRDQYDNVCDYHNLNNSTGAVDQLGNAVAGLTAYNVSVTVTGNVGDATTLGPAANPVNNTGVLRVLYVEVEVTHDDVPGFQVRLAGYRTNYRCNVVGNAACLPR